MADIDGNALLFAAASMEGIGSIFNGRGAAVLLAVSSMSGAGVVENRHLSASLSSKAAMAGDGTVKNVTLKASLHAKAACAGEGGLRFKGAAYLIASSSLSLLGGSAKRGSAELRAVATWVGGGRRIRDALGVCDIVREIYLLWGFEYPCAAPDWAREAALTDLNHALQILWNRASDRSYWTQTEITITLLAGVSSQVLDDNIQNVVGPARYVDTGEPLIPIGTRQEVAQFPALFLDGEDDGVPVGYYIERERQAANDPVKCTLHVSPAPAADVDFLLEVVREAPRYSWDDVTTCPRVPVPHRYVESLLIPIARHLAMQRHMAITKPEAREAIEKAYAEASMLLDEADPLPAKAGDNLNRRKEDRA